MIRLYGDTSGQKGLLVAACYLGTDKHWARFERQWSIALRQAKAHEFHATDFYSCRGAFKGWELNGRKHIRFAKWFTSIAQRHLPIGFAIGVDLDAYQRLIAPPLTTVRTPHRRHTPLMFAVQFVLRRAAEESINRYELIDAVFEDEPGLGEVIDHFNWLKSQNERWANRYASLAVGTKTDHRIQAADLFAHEAWRRLNEVRQPMGGRPLRKSLGRLLRGGKIEVKMMTEENMQESLPRLLDFIRQHPTGLARS